MFSKPPSLADTLPPEQQRASEAEIDLEKCRLLFQNAGIAQAIVSIDGAILVFILGGFHPPLWALVWLLAVFAVAALRYGLSLQFRRSNAGCGDAALWQQRATR